MIDMLRKSVDEQCTQHVHKRRKHAQFLKDLDIKKYGKQQAYSSIRPPALGLMTQVTHTETTPYQLSTPLQFGLCQVALPEGSVAQPHLPGFLDNCEATIVSWQAPFLELMIQSDDADFPQTGQFSQQWIKFAPSEVADELHGFWSTYWNRDTLDETIQDDDWGDFLQLLDHLEPSEPIPTEGAMDVENWLSAIKKTNSRTARGICGFADELKQLPETFEH